MGWIDAVPDPTDVVELQTGRRELPAHQEPGVPMNGLVVPPLSIRDRVQTVAIVRFPTYPQPATVRPVLVNVVPEAHVDRDAKGVEFLTAATLLPAFRRGFPLVPRMESQARTPLLTHVLL